jgi:hypothetical protein
MTIRSAIACKIDLGLSVFRSGHKLLNAVALEAIFTRPSIESILNR